MTTTMNFSAIKAMNDNMKAAVKGLKEGEKYTNSVEGALGIITKYWNKGYNTFFQNVGLDLAKPKDVAKYVKGLCKGENRHALMETTITKGKKEVVVIGVWGEKILTDKSVTVQDANGKDTHPYIKGADGKPIKVEYVKAVTRWTPSIVCQIVLQNVVCEMGKVPFTEEDYFAEEAARAAAKAAKDVKRPTSKKNTKKNAA